jgi:hypothetical protein
MAVTVRARVRRLLRDAGELLADRTLPSDLRTSLESTQAGLKQTWGDLKAAAEVAEEPDDDGAPTAAVVPAAAESAAEVQEVIKHEEDGWHLYSKDGTKHLGGPYASEEEAKKREAQVEYFKHKGEGGFSLEDALLMRRPLTRPAN